MSEAKEPTLLNYHFHKEEEGNWIIFAEWGGDIAYTPEIFEQYIRPHISLVQGVGDHLFYSRDFSLDTVGYGKLPARMAIHFFGGTLHSVKVACGGLDPLERGVPVNQFVLRLPLMVGAPLIESGDAKPDPAPHTPLSESEWTAYGGTAA